MMNQLLVNSGINMIDKATARKNVVQQRKNMTQEVNDKYSFIIAEKVIAMAEFMECNNLYIYKAFRNEVNTDRIIQKAMEFNKTVAFPKVCGADMNFHIVPKEDVSKSLAEGYMGIMEPESSLPILVPTLEESAGVVIVPGVAFDRNCNRSGYGKGFYDKFLAKYPNLIKIGIAFEYQIFDGIEINNFDIPMDYVITESQIIRRED